MVCIGGMAFAGWLSGGGAGGGVQVESFATGRYCPHNAWKLIRRCNNAGMMRELRTVLLLPEAPQLGAVQTQRSWWLHHGVCQCLSTAPLLE